MVLKAQGTEAASESPDIFITRGELGGRCPCKNPLLAGWRIRHHVGWRHESTAVALMGLPKSLCVVSRTPRVSGGFCREGSQSIRSRILRKKHLPYRGGDGMETWSTGHYKTQPFSCDSLPVPARGEKEMGDNP